VSLKIPLKKEYNVLTEFVLSLILLFFILNEFMVRFKGLEIKSLLVSLFAAVYAAVLFVVGFKLKKKHLRYASIAIFVITALKIVLCDAWEQSLALKSVIFLTEGGIFLLISYLYSKFFKDK
jgi:predicted membrane protein